VFSINGSLLKLDPLRLVRRTRVLKLAPESFQLLKARWRNRFTEELHAPESMFTFVEHPKALDDSSPPIHLLMLTTLHPAAQEWF
jgi:hypothetical protein